MVIAGREISRLYQTSFSALNVILYMFFYNFTTFFENQENNKIRLFESKINREKALAMSQLI